MPSWNVVEVILDDRVDITRTSGARRSFLFSALLGGWGGGGGLSHPLSLKFWWQLSLTPEITDTVIPKITYLLNFTIGGNFLKRPVPL